MTSEKTHRRGRLGVMILALCFAVLGAMLLFAPDEVSHMMMPGATGGWMAQLLGAAFLGFGVMSWTARGSVLGGIYGRAVVAGNQTHLTIGALLLVKGGFELGVGNPAYWAFTGLYVLGAGYFGYLTFFSSGIRDS